MAAAGGGAGLGTATGLEAATLQKLSLRRKKALEAEEMELYELAQAAGTVIDPDVFKILVDLLNLNVAPLAVFQILKSMCAGQRLASDPQDSVAISLSTSETRGLEPSDCLGTQSRSLTERWSHCSGKWMEIQGCTPA
ncbi:mitotic-spindle organizing protein 2B isoform X2 [Microtus pennsylvanicus]|uniref:mitotic-spindle organizing protein 2B isoform X2 n=1 Tax=Microtus pennsylvanicus TaxID=10058 RepID=UPI003F6AF02F